MRQRPDTQDQLGVRKYSENTRMMAGYYSHFTHSAVFDLLKERVQHGSLVGDIGAGEGAFSERLLANGYKVVAVEGFCDFRVKDVKLYKSDLNSMWAGAISERLDAVVAIEIIEHLENPFHFLRQIRSIIKDGGCVFISTPNMLNFVSRYNLFRKGHLEMMVHPDHRTPIFPQTLEKYCVECGFQIVHHSYDIDTLSVRGATIKTKVLRAVAKIVSRMSIKDVYAKGNSNIWVLKAASAEVYIPPSHP